jgi:hypothetical protein
MEFTTIGLHPAPVSLIALLVEAMNEEDRAELDALANGDVVAVIERTIEASSYSFAYIVAEGPVAMGGINGNRAWMVAAADRLEKHKKDFLRYARIEIEAMKLVNPPPIRTLVDKRWRKSLRLLGWLGFKQVGEVVYNEREGIALELAA